MDNKIFLNEFSSKKSTSNTSGLNVSLGGKRKLLPTTDMSYVISAYEQYQKEREKCNIVRLTCQVNPICTNVLFNRVTEIVKKEGSSGITMLNYGVSGDSGAFNGVMYKTRDIGFWSGNSASYQSVDSMANSMSYQTTVTKAVTISSRGENYNNVEDFGEVDSLHPTNAIRDMQLSKADENGNPFVYHCGLDIMNNHLIRSKSFKPISRMPNNADSGYTAFNTIADLMRDVSGNKVIEKMYFPVSAQIDGNTKILARHLYEYDDIRSFSATVASKLVDKYNGWLGFVNSSKIKSYDDFDDNESLGIERPLMYMNGGDYVDMYPSRDLYSFIPKWNEYRQRMEKNWNYCITYPSSSTTKGFEEIIETNNGINSLKAIYFDENTRADNGTSQLVIYSISKHGLAKGDYVNVYNTYEESGETITERVIENAQVKEIVDDYIFTVFGADVQLSDSWVEVSDDDMKSGELSISGETYILDDKKHNYFFKIDEEKDEIIKYYIINKRDDYNGYVNFDDKAQNISYKKVVGGMECDYYVRIFSRMPNFKFASGTTSEYDLYRDGSEMISTYQKLDYDFESHVSRLAFAKNIYSDDIGEIVYTDDIDLSNLKDNLGRPLSSLYLTLIKNNKGYKEWYGFGQTENEWNPNIVSADTIEFSHCFGEVTCGFDYSSESIDGNNLNNIKTINNSGINVGFNCGNINESSERRTSVTNVFEEEIDYEGDVNFYGDLSYYDNFNAVERHIQSILHRFNTAQRESRGSASNKYFKSFVYDEIFNDDYDKNDRYIIRSHVVDDTNNKNEGYYYVPHYEIPIRTFSTLNSVMPMFLTIRSLVNTNNGTRISVLQNHFLGVGDKAMIYDRETNDYYYCLVTSSDNEKTFICDIYTEDGKMADRIPDIFSSDSEKIARYRLFKIDNLEIPSYAHILRDGTCRFIWRNIVNNGMNTSDKTIEEYPFTNGAFYVNRRVDLYLRRQDPLNLYGLYSEDDIIGREMEIERENNYVKDDEIEC